MKISEKRSAALYQSIDDLVMGLRLKYAKTRRQAIDADAVDDDLFKLSDQIYSAVAEALNFEEAEQ